MDTLLQAAIALQTTATAWLPVVGSLPLWSFSFAAIMLVGCLIAVAVGAWREAARLALAVCVWCALGAAWTWSSSSAVASNARFGRLLSDGRPAFPNFPRTMFRRLTRGEVGADWPLTRDDAFVGCVPEVPMFTTIVVVDGRPYALNGTTKARARADRLELEVDGRALAVRFDADDAWWARGEGTPRKYLGPVLDFAQRIGCLTVSPR